MNFVKIFSLRISTFRIKLSNLLFTFIKNYKLIVCFYTNPYEASFLEYIINTYCTVLFSIKKHMFLCIKQVNTLQRSSVKKVSTAENRTEYKVD